jgi:tripartite-type tricarboxylate transporter receptor subunit TctC
METRNSFVQKERLRLGFLAYLFVATIFLGSLLLPSASMADEWPNKKITINIGAAPGGFADIQIRAISAEMSKIFKVPIVIVNMAGGGGGVAAQNTWTAPNDGYTWNGHGGGFRTFGVMAIHDSSPKDWYCIPTMGYIGAISVKEDSPYKTFPDLANDLRKNPGKIPYAASQPTTSWRINMEILKKATGLYGKFVPYPGSAPSHVALLSNDVPFMMTGIGEQIELLRGKKIRALVAFHDKPYVLKDYGEIPPITEFLPEMKPYLPISAWSLITLRADVPKPILKKIDETFVKAMETPAVKEFCEKFEVYPIGKVGDEAQALFQRQASLESWLLYDLGVAKRNPAELRIPKL